MNKAYKFRIYPTEEQKVLIEKTFGSETLTHISEMTSIRLERQLLQTDGDN